MPVTGIRMARDTGWGGGVRRYEALDSLRGICACMVVLYHLHPDGWLTSLGLARNGWMFVDFFFVLSGFVIAASYGERLAQGFPVSRFMALRLGRVYPLHLFVIALIAAINLIASGTILFGEFTESNLIVNLLLLHSFGVTDSLSWNGPSWSIAAEVWAYLCFALLVSLRARIEPWLFGSVALGALTILAFGSDTYLATTFSLGFVRCLFGFSLGVLVWLAREKAQWRSPTAFEIAVVTLVGIYLSLVPKGPLTLLAPMVFAIAVHIFAREGGAVSRSLRAKPFRTLGVLSYAIYMVHQFALARYFDLLAALGRWTGQPLVVREGQSLASDGSLLTEALSIGAIAFTVFLAWFAWRFVENPARHWSRRAFAEQRSALPIAAK